MHANQVSATARFAPRAPSLGPMLNAFTVDVEDYYQVSAFEDQIDRNKWPSYPSRVVNNTQRLLDLLDKHEQGDVFRSRLDRREFPHLVEEIRDRGHEIGSHSFWHRLVYQQTPDEFRIDLRDSLKAIEDASGVRVTCYRAPSFSITKRSQWALEILAEEGIEVDSSIYPIYHDRYGMPDSEPRIHRRETKSGSILEFPPAVLQTRFWNIPVSGGGYFRLYPYRLTVGCMKRSIAADSRTCSTSTPGRSMQNSRDCRAVHASETWRHRVNLKSTFAKLDLLLRHCRFGTLRESILAYAARCSIKPNHDASTRAKSLRRASSHPFVADERFAFCEASVHS